MRLRTLSLVTLIALCSIVPARSQDARGVPRGGGRIRKCMADNSDTLSPPCKAALGSQRKSD
jgi:hypothetical protein